MTDRKSIEPDDGDYVRYIERLQSGRGGELKPMEVPDTLQTPDTTAHPKTSGEGVSMRDLLGAFKKKSETKDEVRTEALERMEASTREPAQTAPARKSQKIDPALNFVSSAFGMFGLMGALIGIDSQEPAPIIFGVFAILIAAFMQVNARIAMKRGTYRRTNTTTQRGRDR
ncbi:hypothetical protein [Sutterella sp.]|uniref:hypothetical protein n=1 Tax=Sutterella sp. TaxID=1981025 RepID=UPI0026DEC6A6|nr:hypothetical protein [Sutterella sp.]MDO5530972.1 hypothetical protein [Sutterella sp.]